MYDSDLPGFCLILFPATPLQPSPKRRFSMEDGSLEAFRGKLKGFGETCWRWTRLDNIYFSNESSSYTRWPRRRRAKLRYFVYPLPNGTWKLMWHAWLEQSLRRCRAFAIPTTSWPSQLKRSSQWWIASSRGAYVQNIVELLTPKNDCTLWTEEVD